MYWQGRAGSLSMGSWLWTCRSCSAHLLGMIQLNAAFWEGTPCVLSLCLFPILLNFGIRVQGEKLSDLSSADEQEEVLKFVRKGFREKLLYNILAVIYYNWNTVVS